MKKEIIKIKNFTDLNTWKEAHRLVLAVYKITQNFPREELFGLTSQIRRAAISITSNVAEGFSRKSYKEKSQFYSMALGSLTEVQNHTIIARDLGYIAEKVFKEIEELVIIVSKLLNGLIKKSKTMGVITHDS